MRLSSIGVSLLLLVAVGVSVRAEVDLKDWAVQLEKDPANAYLWANLGGLMSVDQSVDVDSEPFTKQEVLVRALELDPAVEQTWRHLADTIAEAEPTAANNKKKTTNPDVDVSGDRYTRQQCFQQAATIKSKDLATQLKTAPKDSKLWLSLAMTLGEVDPPLTATVELRRGRPEKMEALQCFAKVLELDADDGEAWYQLGSRLGQTHDQSSDDGQTVGTLGRITEKECYVRALSSPASQRLSHTRKAWLNLGLAMTSPQEHVTLVFNKGETEEYSKQQCYLEAVRGLYKNRKKKNADASEQVLDVVDLSTVEVSEAWTLLASAIPKGTNVRLLQSSLSTTDGGAVKAVVVTQRDAYVQAVLYDRDNGRAWTNLGTSIKRGSSVKVGAKRFTERECYLEALRCDPKDTKAWANIAMGMKPNDRIMVTPSVRDAVGPQAVLGSIADEDEDNEREEPLVSKKKPANGEDAATTFTRSTVIVKAIESAMGSSSLLEGKGRDVDSTGKQLSKEDPTQSKLWLMLATALEPTTRIFVGQRFYHKIDAFVQSLQHDAKQSMAWLSLGLLLQPPATVDVQGEELDKLKCIQKALALNPSDERGWAILTLSLAEGGRVTINGQQYDRDECATKGKKFLPGNWKSEQLGDDSPFTAPRPLGQQARRKNDEL